ncbi:hypothetical protein NUW58_g3361 [Xylaria curta]|uniref:Uncharacterized protein n=1 Tax=Xylaria curta TaxID=42375 RepID=A0ACC1PBC6_9PEZI|nr:hypothetical protein NUW58_g3361 [Xylaria curta]
MDTDASDSLLSNSDWPNDNIYLVPSYLDEIQKDYTLLKSKFRHYIQTVDPAAGFDLDWLIVHICERTYWTIRIIADEAPRVAPANPELITSTHALASQLQAIIGDEQPPDFLSSIDALPNPEWDAIFKNYCRLLEAGVDAFIIADSPTYQVKLSNVATPDLIFRVLRTMVVSLGEYPLLRAYHNRLMKKLGASRSGVIYTEFWMNELESNSGPTPKHKLDTLDSGGSAKRPAI